MTMKKGIKLSKNLIARPKADWEFELERTKLKEHQKIIGIIKQKIEELKAIEMWQCNKCNNLMSIPHEWFLPKTKCDVCDNDMNSNSTKKIFINFRELQQLLEEIGNGKK